ncbi:MAG TPA: class I SAM-dependent methyltransferase [Spirochaetota bacterium]|nr:class I SAM-dependent methyltransferase [Spirochaetota bacterium]
MSKDINKLLYDYYYDYYKIQLGLRDYDERIKNRLNEESLFAKPNLNKLEYLLNYDFKDKRILVVGGGTGAEVIALSLMNANVYVVEPNKEAIEIIKQKCLLHNLSENKIKLGVAEQIKFDDNFFDFVYCFTVIEHVQNVEKSIKEMIRVVKKDGYIYINTPDYRQYYEAHYKMYLPLSFPKFLIKIILLVNKKPTKFVDSLQFVNARQLKNIFKRNNVIASQYFFPYEYPEKKQYGWKKKIRNIQDKKEIEQNQFWILRKQ